MRIAGVPHYTVIDASVAAFAKVVDALESEGVPYSLTHGTALGAVRHGGFIPHDDDLDLLVPRRFGGLVTRLAGTLGATSLYTDHPWGPETCLQKIRFAGCLDVDLFNEDSLEAPELREALAPFYLPERPVLDRIEFCGRAFSIVPNVRQYLDLQYGPDWVDTVHGRGIEMPLDRYLQQRAEFRQTDLRTFGPASCVVVGVFDGLQPADVRLLARAWQLFGHVTAAVESDRVVRERGQLTALRDRERLVLVGSLRWVQRTVLIATPDCSPSSDDSPGAVDRLFEAYGGDFLVCGVDDANLDEVRRRYGHAAATGRLRTIDRSP